MIDEKILMDGDNKQIILTTHRVRQEKKIWGRVDLVSIMLEQITSCHYSRRSKPVFFIVGLLVIVLAYITGIQGGEDVQTIAGGLILVGLILIIIYFFTIKRGLYISSPTAKIKLNTKGMKDENIKSFIDKLEVAKNDRLLGLKIN